MMTMEIKSQLFAAKFRHIGESASIGESCSTSTATAGDSFLGCAPDTSRTSSTRRESADMLVDGFPMTKGSPKRRNRVNRGVLTRAHNL